MDELDACDSSRAGQAVVSPRPSGRSIRASGRRSMPFVGHVLALAVVLVLGFLFVHPDQLQQADEGAAVAQAHQLESGDGWRFAHPFPAADPQGIGFPLDLSTRVGTTNDWVVFEKHPVYPVVLAGAMRLGGLPAAVALSTLGTLIAAVFSALIARRLYPGLDRLTLWSVGVGSPLLFDGYQVIAHTLGAAAVAVAVYGVVARDRSWVVRLLAVIGGLGAAVVFRNEALLLAAALGAGTLVFAWRLRSKANAALGLVCWAAGISAAFVDRWLSSQVTDAGTVQAFRTTAANNFMVGRIKGFQTSMLAAAQNSVTATLAAYVAFALFAFAAVNYRRSMTGATDDAQRSAVLTRVAPLFALGVGFVVVRAVVAPDEVIPGLLIACPALLCGFVLLPRAWWRDATTALLVTTTALFAVAVLATQYADGGGGGWGGRYFAIGIPVALPVAWDALRRAVVVPFASADACAMVSGRVVRMLSVSVVVLQVALGAHALVAMRLAHEWTGQLHDFVATATADVAAGDGESRPVVVTTSRALARLSWDELERGRWLTVKPEDLTALGQRLHTLGVERFTLASGTPVEEAALLAAQYEVVGTPRAPMIERPWHGATPYGVFVVELRAKQ